MDFILGIFGIFQIIFIPGLIVYKALNFRGNLIDKILIVFSLSLISNYCLIFLLSALGIYTRIALGIIILCELIAVVWLYREGLNTSIKDFLITAWDDVNVVFSFLVQKRQSDNGTSVLNSFLVALFLLLSLKNIVWAINTLFQNIGTVFSSWDAVVSWNRWATVWAAGQIPMDSQFYPQLIPANWSITYVLLGSPDIQFFAKGIMPLFALLMLVGLINLSIQTRQIYFFISLALIGPLLKKFLGIGVSNGYVDIAVAFFAFMTIYMLLLAQRALELEQLNKLLVIGAIFSAGAAVTKQTGVYVALCYPILAFFNITSLDSSLRTKWLKTFISWLAVVSIIWVSWYLFKEIQILSGNDSSHLDVLINVSADSYDNVSLPQQILTALSQFGRYIVLFIVIALTFPWMDRFYKVLTILIAPYPLLWAWMAGYDMRNLAIFWPLLALIAGYSINKLILKFLEINERIKILRIPIYVPIVLIGIALVYLNVIIPPQELHQSQVVLQKQIFSPSKNQMLYDLIAEQGLQTKILTNYPMEYLPGLMEFKVRSDFKDYDFFLGKLNDPNIRYILLPNSIDSNIEEFINTRIEVGDYELIVTDKEWKVYKLIKILNR